jgi:hypothetical protein
MPACRRTDSLGSGSGPEGAHGTGCEVSDTPRRAVPRGSPARRTAGQAGGALTARASVGGWRSRTSGCTGAGAHEFVGSSNAVAPAR